MENNLIQAAKTGDLERAAALIESGAYLDEGDEQGWTALNFAAGRGDLALVELLVKNGADVFKVGRDNRTAYMIALAAGRAEVARYLRSVEDEVDAERAKAGRPTRPYCKAYALGALRRFPSWSESRINWKDKKDSAAEASFADDKIVFVHQDFTVTESMWHGENVLFNQATPEWKEFCEAELKFKAPDDLDLIVPASAQATVS